MASPVKVSTVFMTLISANYHAQSRVYNRLNDPTQTSVELCIASPRSVAFT